MKFFILVIIFAISFCNVTFANNDEPIKKTGTDAMLFGHVTSGKEHVPFVTIFLEGTTIATAADVTGHFKMTDLPTGEQTVVFSAVGYKTLKKVVDLEPNESVTVYADLQIDNIGIEQVVVSADRNEKSRKKTPTIVNSINPKLFNRTQNVTLSEGLNFTPGLRMENNCQNCGFSQVRMNGMEGPYSQILINSRPVFSGLAGVYGLELIPANMIERVEVVRGGGSSMYGSNAIAGTINLITKDPIADRFAVSVSKASNGVDNGYNSSDDYNLKFNGSMVSDDYKTGLSLYGFNRERDSFDANGDGYSELSEIENVTLGARLFQRVATRGKLTADYFHINEYRRGGDSFEKPVHEANIAESVRHSINSVAFNFDLLLREFDKFSIFLSTQKVNRDSYYGANNDLSAYGNTDDFTYSSGIQYIRNLDKLIFSPAVITSGIEINGSSLTDEKLGYYNLDEKKHYENILVADQKILINAAFMQAEWSIEKLILCTGLRFDYYKIQDREGVNENIDGKVISPRINLLYNFSEHIQFRTGYARGFRAPQIFDEDLHIETSGSRKVIHENDKDLKQESSNSYTASVEYSNKSGQCQYQILAEGFYTELKNPFANDYGTPNEDGVVVYKRVNAEKGANVKGINLEFNTSPVKELQIQSGITMQKSEFDEPQKFNEKRFFRSPERYGFVSLNYNPWKNFNIACTGNYTGKMLVPYFGPRIKNSKKGLLVETDSFFDAGIKLAYNIKMTKNIKVEINSGIKNIFNSYQDDFDIGKDRDPSYIYGPLNPRTIYMELKIGTI